MHHRAVCTFAILGWLPTSSAAMPFQPFKPLPRPPATLSAPTTADAGNDLAELPSRERLLSMRPNQEQWATLISDTPKGPAINRDIWTYRRDAIAAKVAVKEPEPVPQGVDQLAVALQRATPEPESEPVRLRADGRPIRVAKMLSVVVRTREGVDHAAYERAHIAAFTDPSLTAQRTLSIGGDVVLWGSSDGAVTLTLRRGMHIGTLFGQDEIEVEVLDETQHGGPAALIRFEGAPRGHLPFVGWYRLDDATSDAPSKDEQPDG